MLTKKFKTLTCASAAVMTFALTFSQPANAGPDAYIGEIFQVGFNFAPRGSALCDGQLLPISQNSALFSLLGTTFGGDGRTTFGLPDLRGRSMVHPGNGPGLPTVSWGERGGSASFTLSAAQIPSHNHTAATSVDNVSVTLHANSGRGNSSSPDGTVMSVKSRTNIYSSSAPDVTMNSAAATASATASTTVGNTGGSQSVNKRSPYLGVYHVIATVGIFPSRS